MDDFADEENKLTLEKVIGKVHQEIGETITHMDREVLDIPDFTSRFLQGNLIELFDSIYKKFESFGYSDLIERAKPLAKQASDIWLEKGYRFSPALLTAREHQECRSSGYGQYMVMPDTVVSIANQTLKIIEKEDEPMTIEEIRRARILEGMPTIDDTGTVTGEIVPITDSYHFLSEERKAEVKRLELQIISELRSVVYEAIARKVANLTKYEGVIRDIANGRISRAVGYSKLEELNMPLEVAEEAMKLAYQEGCKDNILTPMEIMFLGREVDEKYKINPYTPIGIQKGSLNVEEANKLRAEEKYFDLVKDLFTKFQMPFALSLETLNAEGKTERGPLVLDPREREPLDNRRIDLYKPNIPQPIPFSRPIDWYHKEQATLNTPK